MSTEKEQEISFEFSSDGGLLGQQPFALSQSMGFQSTGSSTYGALNNGYSSGYPLQQQPLQASYAFQQPQGVVQDYRKTKTPKYAPGSDAEIAAKSKQTRCIVIVVVVALAIVLVTGIVLVSINILLHHVSFYNAFHNFFIYYDATT